MTIFTLLPQLPLPRVVDNPRAEWICQGELGPEKLGMGAEYLKRLGFGGEGREPKD